MEYGLGKRVPLIDKEIYTLGVAVFLLYFVLPYKNLPAEILIYGLGAVSFNIILGFTGMLSFGHGAFFGTGAYTTGLLLKHLGWHPLISLLCAAISGMITAFLMGIFSIKRIGLYFVMLTLAFNQLAFFITYQWKHLTGGDDGLLNVPRPDLSIIFGFKFSIQSNFHFFLFVWVIFMISMIIIRRVLRSPFGRILVAIKEDSDRARAVGYNIMNYKLIAFIISGGFTGISGGLYALFMKMVPITAIELLTSTDFIIMSLLGGIGSLYGPVLGAIIVKTASEVISAFWPRWLLPLGLIFIIFVIFMRGGVWAFLTTILIRMKSGKN
ncbi:MAG: branched-chain amino acid ABC transporter permease, partial [Candidatus Bathyarchaeia archaeon]